ncbi:MAG: ABC transporter ATP-binding protein [Euryarchaeota archaeon]|nr:ABC transporter ATP-binding protein [Euryarchaeota archaeon]
MLRIENLSYEYESGFCLKNIELTLEKGESVGIIGENGSGKTTLVKHLIGLLRPDAGKIFLDGEDTSERSVAEIAGKVGFVFQNPENQIFASTVREEVAFGPQNLKMDNIDKKVDAVLQKSDLFRYRESHPLNLSGGEKQRLAMASILVMEQEVLILDEPTSGLDLKNAQRLIEIVKTLQRERKTLIVISHDMELISQLCERVVLMKSGEIIADGKMEEIFTDTVLLERTSLDLPEIAKLSKILGYGVLFDPTELYKRWRGGHD